VPGVNHELRAFVLAHGKCAGRRLVRVKCGCGIEFTRWVTPVDVGEDLLRSALLAFEN
jgi:hypothetical protein